MRLKNRKKSAAAIKSMKVGTDELKDLIKGAVKEAMGEEDDTGDDGRDTAAALDGVTAEDMADIIISIHALCEEGDDVAEGVKISRMDFYPRPLRGGRQQKQRRNLYFQTNYTTFCTNLEEP